MISARASNLDITGLHLCRDDIFHNNPCNDMISARASNLDITGLHLCRMTFFIIILVTI